MYTTYVYNSLPSIDARTAGGQGHGQKGGLDEEEQEEKKNNKSLDLSIEEYLKLNLR